MSRPRHHTVTTVDDPSPARLLELETELVRYNAEHAPLEQYAPLAVFAHDADRLVGGVSGFTHWNWLFIELLWVHQDVRSTGLGSELLALIEARAMERGATASRVSSYSFQAPDFYRRHGYRQFGLLDEYPLGSSLHFFCKLLESTHQGSAP